VNLRPLAARLETFALFTLLFGVLLLLAAWFGWQFGVTSLAWFVAWGGAALGINFTIYLMCDRLVIWSYAITFPPESEAPLLHRVVEDLARQAAIPKPKVGLIADPGPNAMATGRSPRTAIVACTTGLLALLNEFELRGVIAHELSHVKDRDTVVLTTVATVAAFFAYAVPIAVLSTAGRNRFKIVRAALTALVASIGGALAASLIKAFVTRSREYRADASAARLLADSRGLENALLKIDYGLRGAPMRTAHAASAHLFFVSPLTHEDFHTLFASHPDIDVRIERLRAMGLGSGPLPPTAGAPP
jgi:heat shock protein HtpX